jgi:hypothetical protein
MKVVYPKGVAKPYPLVYVPHYEIAEDSAELRAYLKEGWATASTAAFTNDYNKVLTDDDLVFNNAAMYTLRNLKNRQPENRCYWWQCRWIYVTYAKCIANGSYSFCY